MICMLLGNKDYFIVIVIVIVRSQMEWTILDCGRTFPLHGEVIENSQQP